MRLGISAHAELEVELLAQPFDEVGGIRKAAGMRLVCGTDTGNRITTQRDEMAHAGVPVLTRHLDDLVARGTDAGEMCGGAQRGVGEQAAHGGVRPLTRRAAGAVGHGNEVRGERCQAFDGAPELRVHLLGLRWEELEGDAEGAAVRPVENRRAHTVTERSGSEQSQMTTVSGAPWRRAASRACRPAAEHQCVMSSVANPSRRWAC